MDKVNKFRYYVLYTGYGPIYYYEKYIEGKEMPEIREFFTGEKGTQSYCSVLFYDDKAKFETRHVDFSGETTGYYSRELSSYDFLMKVAPYLKNQETKEKKKTEVYCIFSKKANNIGNDDAIMPEETVSEEQKERVASKILALYLR